MEVLLLIMLIILGAFLITRPDVEDNKPRQSDQSSNRNAYAQAYIARLGDNEANREAIEKLKSLQHPRCK